MRFALSLYIAATSAVACLAAATAAVPPDSSPSKGSYERVKVHGRNLEGDSPDRFVSVYLPPGYKSHPNQRYPVIYLLHGFTDSDDKWFGLKPHFVNVPQIADRSMTAGASKEMIIVMPNAYTALEGSFYGKSVTTGDWEDFVVSELVEYIDSITGQLPNRTSRGLAGHSMGGYGTVRLGMRRPDVFSSFYALSACCLDSGAAGTHTNHVADRIETKVLPFFSAQLKFENSK